MKKFQDNPVITYLIALMFFPSLQFALGNRYELLIINCILILFVLLKPTRV